MVTINHTTKMYLLLRESNILVGYILILREDPSINLNTDAWSDGRGSSIEDIRIVVHFKTAECNLQINILELKTALFILQTLCKNMHSSHILILIENTSAVAAKIDSINSLDMDQVAQKIRTFVNSSNS